VTVKDAAGQTCPLEATPDGYLRLPVRPGDTGLVRVTFAWTPRVENRRLQQLTIRPDAIGRYLGVVLCDGPRILLANTQPPQPVIVAIVDKQGRLALPRTSAGSCSMIPGRSD